MVTRKYLALAVLGLAALSCGTRGPKGEDAGQEDSLATETRPASALQSPDTAAVRKYRGALPEEPFFDIVTNKGTIRVKLYKDTPRHRDNFIRLAQAHFYDDVLFHRVIDGFVIQGGDPFTRDTARVEEWGEGGPGYDIPAEIVPEHTHKKGALAAARRGDAANPLKESSGSQFYLVQDPVNCAHLDGQYTVFGETVGGLNVIDRIASVSRDRFDRPIQPVVIQSIRPNEPMNQKALEDGALPLETHLTGDEPAIQIRDYTPKQGERGTSRRPTLRNGNRPSGESLRGNTRDGFRNRNRDRNVTIDSVSTSNQRPLPARDSTNRRRSRRRAATLKTPKAVE